MLHLLLDSVINVEITVLLAQVVMLAQAALPTSNSLRESASVLLAHSSLMEHAQPALLDAHHAVVSLTAADANQEPSCRVEFASVDAALASIRMVEHAHLAHPSAHSANKQISVFIVNLTWSCIKDYVIRNAQTDQ